MGEKFKVCISVDESTLLAIKTAVRERKFRNRSHVFEYAVAQLLEGKE